MKKTQKEVARCHWATSELNIPYHDEEWGVPVHDEHKWFELRGEAFNLANTPVFNSPISQTITSATFGEVSTTSAERSVQVVAKFTF